MNEFGDNLIAWCPRCREPVRRWPVRDATGVILDERDPFCPKCNDPAELISPAALHEREVNQQAVANARAMLTLSSSAASRADKKDSRRSSEEIPRRKAYTLQEAATLLGVSHTMVKDLVRDHKIAIVIAGKRRRILDAEIDRYLLSNGRRRS